MSSPDFTKPQRQDITGIAVYFVGNLWDLGRGIIYPLIVVLVQPAIWWLVIVAMVFGLIIAAIIAWLQYQRFYFYISGNEMVIHKGVIVNERTNIAFDRIQTVHLRQNFVHRLLGITGLMIDTAGAQEKAIEIKALKKHQALQLQAVLQASTPEDVVTAESESEADKEAEDRSEVLVSLSMAQLLKVAFTDNHLRNGGVVVAAIFGFLMQYQPFIEDYFRPFMEWMPAIMQTGLVTVSMGVAVFLLMAVLISLIINFHRFYDFQASLSRDQLQVKGGLFVRNEYSIPYHKIQFLEWRTNFIRKLMGMESVHIFQAQSYENEQSEITIPACFPAHTKRLKESLFGIGEEQAEDAETINPDAYYQWYLTYLPGLAGIVGAAILWWFWSPLYAVYAFFLYMVWVAIHARQYVKSVQLENRTGLMIYKRGWLFPKQTIFRPERLQAVALNQNILQRRRSIGHLVFGTAAGDRVFWFLPIDKARALYNDALYRVETFRGRWI